MSKYNNKQYVRVHDSKQNEEVISEMKLELNDFFSEIYESGKDGIPNFKIYSGGKWHFPESGEFTDVRSPIDNSVIEHPVRICLRSCRNSSYDAVVDRTPNISKLA